LLDLLVMPSMVAMPAMPDVAALDPRRAALTELDGMLALARTGPLSPDGCRRLLELAPEAPGRARQIVDVLARQCDAAAVDALLELPGGTPGIIEGLFAALRHGVVRRGANGHEFPHMLALEFRSSPSRRFPGLLARASAAFGSELERLRVDARLHYRFALIANPVHDPGSSLRERAAPVELDVEQLHRDLARLRGVRLWLNGWCFDDASKIAPRARSPLLRAWFEWVHADSPA
jgi:hypothetical protein